MRSLIFLALLACEPKDKPAEASAPPASTSAAPAPEDAAPTKENKNEWSGAYEATPGTLFVPDAAEWKGVKFRGDDAGEGLGSGTLHVRLNPDNTLTGEGDGPLGAILLTGTAGSNQLTFTIRRKDPTDMGFTGTGTATLEGDKLTGTLRVSKATANIIREATFTLHR